MTHTQQLYLALADLVLIVHTAFVVFVVAGLVLIWIGGYRKWHFVRNLWFRGGHLAAIGVVAAEALAGFICPLTTWENQLRILAGGGERYGGSFIQHWLHRLMFCEFREDVFLLIYLTFLLLVAASFWLVPVNGYRNPRAERKTSPTEGEDC